MSLIPCIRLGPQQILALLLLGSAISSTASAAICRVTPEGSSSNDGSAWASPVDLQTALDTAACNEIWVAAGTYTPGSARSDRFRIHSGVAVYGGFSGNETTRDARETSANITTLSGDIGTLGDNADNSYHVVFMDGASAVGPIYGDTVLDGFTISAGNADASEGPNAYGGGLYCSSVGFSGTCSPILRNITFSGNHASNGGGLYNHGFLSGTSSPVLSNVTFSGNSANRGGAMFNLAFDDGTSNPILNNVTFSGNSANRGGAILNYADYEGTAKPTLNNVTFNGNHASQSGGAMQNDISSDSTGMPHLINVILWNDNAPINPEISPSNSSATIPIYNSIVQGGCPAANTAFDCEYVSGDDPQLGPLQDNGGSTPTRLPAVGSSAIDAGNDATCLPMDQRGISRPQGPHCDIGAVEVLSDLIFNDGFDGATAPQLHPGSWPGQFMNSTRARLILESTALSAQSAIRTQSRKTPRIQ